LFTAHSALQELSEHNLLEEKEGRKFWVNRELYGKCQEFFEGLQETLVGWVNDWRKKEGITYFERESSHFYLSGRLLPKFSENLIEQARQEISVASPYVRRCNISESLLLMNKKGVGVNLLTRGIGTEQLRKELSKGVFITCEESIHAKLIVVDRRVGVVSSMNFYAGFSAGECWEARIVSIDKHVVGSIMRSIQEKIVSSNIE
jgi:hypothetical protein